MNCRPLVRAQRGSLRSNILPQGKGRNSPEGEGVDCGGGASATLSSHLFNSNCFYHICLTAHTV